MKFQIENQWLVIAKKNRKVAASFLGSSVVSPSGHSPSGMVYGLTNAISIPYYTNVARHRTVALEENRTEEDIMGLLKFAFYDYHTFFFVAGALRVRVQRISVKCQCYY